MTHSDFSVLQELVLPSLSDVPNFFCAAKKIGFPRARSSGWKVALSVRPDPEPFARLFPMFMWLHVLLDHVHLRTWAEAGDSSTPTGGDSYEISCAKMPYVAGRGFEKATFCMNLTPTCWQRTRRRDNDQLQQKDGSDVNRIYSGIKVWTNQFYCRLSLPICCMYGIFTCICHKYMVNVGKYSMHWSIWSIKPTDSWQVALDSGVFQPLVASRWASLSLSASSGSEFCRSILRPTEDPNEPWELNLVLQGGPRIHL